MAGATTTDGGYPVPRYIISKGGKGVCGTVYERSIQPDHTDLLLIVENLDDVMSHRTDIKVCYDELQRDVFPQFYRVFCHRSNYARADTCMRVISLKGPPDEVRKWFNHNVEVVSDRMERHLLHVTGTGDALPPLPPPSSASDTKTKKRQREDQPKEGNNKKRRKDVIVPETDDDDDSGDSTDGSEAREDDGYDEMEEEDRMQAKMRKAAERRKMKNRPQPRRQRRPQSSDSSSEEEEEEEEESDSESDQKKKKKKKKTTKVVHASKDKDKKDTPSPKKKENKSTTKLACLACNTAENSKPCSSECKLRRTKCIVKPCTNVCPTTKPGEMTKHGFKLFPGKKGEPGSMYTVCAAHAAQYTHDKCGQLKYLSTKDAALHCLACSEQPPLVSDSELEAA